MRFSKDLNVGNSRNIVEANVKAVRNENLPLGMIEWIVKFVDVGEI